MSSELWWKKYADKREYKAGQMIFMQGDPADEIFVISEGQVVIAKHTEEGESVALGYRGPGELFGEIALIHESPRTASASAVRDTSLRVLKAKEFWNLMNTDKSFPRLIIETLIDRLLASDDVRVQAELWERQVVDRFVKLRGENERMAEIMQLRRETMHFIVHDLRNPIGLAGTALELMETLSDEDTAIDTRRLIGMANGGLRRMLHMVDSLLDVERLDEGADALVRANVDLVDLARNTVEMQQAIAKAGGFKLVSKLPQDGKLATIKADASRIERVIVNLLDNAFKFTPDGGTVTLAIEPDADNKQVKISVSDTGPGIAEDQRNRVFDRFVQADAAHRAKGFGLGLAFCRSAVEAHGGKIWVETGENGAGTNFVFTLPVES